MTPIHRPLRQPKNRTWTTIFLFVHACLILATTGNAVGQRSYHVKTNHPRLLIESVREMVRRSEGPLAEDYRVVKQRADASVRRGGIDYISNGWAIPEDLMNCGLAFLIERQLGREHRHEAWGHPLEPTAQYNHMTDGRKKPPLCPWRIEVGDPGAGTHTLFLHVFEIADETLRQPTDVKFVAPAGLDIGDRLRVRFNASGPLGGQVGDQILATSIKTKA